jgi:hypothetical protein
MTESGAAPVSGDKNIPELLIGVTSRPPSLRMSSLRRFIGGSTGLCFLSDDISNEVAGFEELRLVALCFPYNPDSLSESTKSITSAGGGSNPELFMVILPDDDDTGMNGVTAKSIALPLPVRPDKMGIFSFSIGGLHDPTDAAAVVNEVGEGSTRLVPPLVIVVTTPPPLFRSFFTRT